MPKAEGNPPYFGETGKTSVNFMDKIGFQNNRLRLGKTTIAELRIKQDLGVVGDTSLQKTLDVSGNLGVNNKFTVTAASGNTNISGNTVMAGDLTINGSAVFNGSVSGVTTQGLSSSGTGENAISINASNGGVDIDAANTKDIDIAGGQIKLTSKQDTSEAISLKTNIGTTETISVTNTQGAANGSQSTAGVAGGAIAISSTAGGIGMSWSDSNALWAEGGTAVVTANENTSDAIKLHADSGANQTISLLNDAGTSESAINLTSTSGGVDIDAAQGKNVDIAGGQIKLTSKADSNSTGLADAISLLTPAGTAGGTADTITITNTQGTGLDAISLASTVGGVNIDAAQGKDVDIAGGQVKLVSKANAASTGLAGAISITTPSTTDGGIADTILVTNNLGTGAAAIDMTSSAGGITQQFASTSGITHKTSSTTAVVYKIKTAQVTISTSGTTTTESNFFPTNCVPLALTIKVDVALSGGHHITQVGAGGTATFFGSGYSAGALEQINDYKIFSAFDGAVGMFDGNQRDLTLTTAGTASTGRVMASLYYMDLTAFQP